MDDLNRIDERDTVSPTPDSESNSLRASDRVPDDLHRDDVNTGDEIGEAVGGISGVLTGAAIGSLGGPIGTIIGGIAGAVSGWWAGRAISEAASHVTADEEDHYRTHYEGSTARLADRSYEDVRPAYQLGQLAGRNPDYQSRSFDDVEGDLRSGWSGDVTTRHGNWDQVRDYARHAFDRGRSGFDTGAVAGAAAGSSLGSNTSGMARTPTPSDSAVDNASLGGSTIGGSSLGDSALGGSSLGASPLALAPDSDRSLGTSPIGGTTGVTAGGTGSSLGSTGGLSSAPSGTSTTTSRTWDAANSTAERLGDKAENAWDKTKAGAEQLGRRAANLIDDTKDRIDGNPASKPGPDATDRPER